MHQSPHTIECHISVTNAQAPGWGSRTLPLWLGLLRLADQSDWAKIHTCEQLQPSTLPWSMLAVCFTILPRSSCFSGNWNSSMLGSIVIYYFVDCNCHIFMRLGCLVLSMYTMICGLKPRPGLQSRLPILEPMLSSFTWLRVAWSIWLACSCKCTQFYNTQAMGAAPFMSQTCSAG